MSMRQDLNVASRVIAITTSVVSTTAKTVQQLNLPYLSLVQTPVERVPVHPQRQERPLTTVGTRCPRREKLFVFSMAFYRSRYQ